jgi:hypothetical protein
MKFYKRIRLLKSLALAGCAVGLAAPSVAGAMPIDNPVPHFQSAPQSPTIYHPHGRPASTDYTLPSTFKTDAQSQSQAAGVGARVFVLPASHKADVPSSTTPATPSSTPTVVREVRTVTNDSNHTLAIVLAAAALGIALCGTGYALSRLALIQRRVLGSSS